MPRAGVHPACTATPRRPQPRNAVHPTPSGAWPLLWRSGAPVVESFPRARDHLVISLYRKAGDRLKTNAHVIAERVSELPNDPNTPLFRQFTPEPTQQGERAAGEGTTAERARAVELQEGSDTAASRKQWLEERDAASRANANFEVRSATSLAKGVRPEDPNVEKDERSDDLPPWRRGRAGTSIGRAVHAALQTINMEAADDISINAVAKAQSAAEGLGLSASADVSRLIHVALDSPSLRDAVASDRYWREVYVAAPIADGRGREVLVEGFIDLMYQTDDGDLVIVDYKTDALRDGEAVDQALVRYELKGATYALALEESIRQRVAACRFLFLHANEERSVPNLVAAVERVREALQQPMSD